jgi:hypothetical protein
MFIFHLLYLYSSKNCCILYSIDLFYFFVFSDTYSAILSGTFLRCILCGFLSSMTSGPNRLLSLLLRHGGRVPGTSPRLLISQYGTQADRHSTASTAGEEKAKRGRSGARSTGRRTQRGRRGRSCTCAETWQMGE